MFLRTDTSAFSNHLTGSVVDKFLKDTPSSRTHTGPNCMLFRVPFVVWITQMLGQLFSSCRNSAVSPRCRCQVRCNEIHPPWNQGHRCLLEWGNSYQRCNRRSNFVSGRWKMEAQSYSRGRFRAWRWMRHTDQCYGSPQVCFLLSVLCSWLVGSDWRFPNIPGLKDYQGILLHTANWDDNVELEGKSIAVIGNGSSAIQVVSARKHFAKTDKRVIICRLVTPIVKHLDNYARSNTWIVPG